MTADLIRRAQAGDHAAFETLATAAYERLYGIAYRILRNRDRPPGHSRGPVAWSPDGTRLLYEDLSEGLFLVDPLGSDPQPLDIACQEGSCIGVDAPTFSPDGSREPRPAPDRSRAEPDQQGQRS
jgi:hypothetical protein